MKNKRKYPLIKSALAFINIIAALLLGFSLLAGFTLAEDFSLFAVAGLFYPIFLIINLGFVIFWLFTKKRFAIISLSVILLGTPNLINNFGFSSSDKGDSAKSVKVLSYNVRQFRASDKFTALIVKNDILKFVQEQNADIICFQEFQSHDKNIYEPLKKLRDTLNAGTYYFESYYNPRHNYLSGLVIFSKMRAVNKGKLKIEGSRTFGIFTDLVNGNDTIRVYNIHFASISLNPSDIEFVVNPEIKNKQTFKLRTANIYHKLADAFVLRQKQVAYLTNELEHSPYKILLAGDFNDTPSSYVHAQVSEFLDDSFTKKGSGLGITYAGRLPMLRIDYVFGNKEFEVLDYRTHSILRSDHYPVTASFSTENTSQ